MSRSYKKYASHGICVGSNTEYYRNRNRSTRNKNRHALRNMLANMSIDDIADVITTLVNRNNRDYDSWGEPTDGKTAAKTMEEYLGGSLLGEMKKYYPEDYEWEKKWFEKCKRK